MNISHHFDDATLMAYAAGTLPQGMALVVACHLHWCPECRHRVKQAEAVGGALLDNISPVAVSDSALDDILASLDEVPAAAPKQVKTSEPNQTELPDPLSTYLNKSLDDLPWKWIGYGMYQVDLNFGGKGAARLFKLAPGVSVPHHTHTGNELTLILRGSYSDEIGRFRRGDVADLDSDVLHQPIVDTGEDCICLIATDAPLKFTGIMGRLIQPFIGL